MMDTAAATTTIALNFLLKSRCAESRCAESRCAESRCAITAAYLVIMQRVAPPAGFYCAVSVTYLMMLLGLKFCIQLVYLAIPTADNIAGYRVALYN